MKIDPLYVAKWLPNMAAANVTIQLGLQGYSNTVVTACASGTQAIGEAVEVLRRGSADVMFAGGTEAGICELGLAGFAAMRALTTSYNGEPERASRPFDRDRDGFAPAEGAGMVVLETLEHAQARGATPLVEVLGYGGTCEAYHRVRLLEDGKEPARAMALAIAEAGLHPEAVDYVALHGTSTRMNDVVETRAVTRALGDHAREIPMSALKSMIGHPQGASGAAGVVATLLSMRDGFIHPTANLDHPDPDCDLDYVPREGRPHSVDVALCNCIGFGSKNAALVLRRWRADVA